MVHLLYRYTLPDDPCFEEFSYGEAGAAAEFLKNNLKKGDYIFFFKNISGKLYITAYYVFSWMIEGEKARRDRELRKRYKNPHLDPAHYRGRGDIIIFGDPIKSRKLWIPLPLDRKLLEKLSLKIPWRKDRTEAQNISSALRNVRGRNCRLTDEQVQILLNEIENVEYSGVFPLEGWDETTIERILAKNPSIMGEGLTLLQEQMSTPHGIIDLVFKNREGDELVVVEVKEGMAPDHTLTQLLSYINYIKNKYPKRRVRGAIVCANCSQRLIKAAMTQEIKVFFYQGKFTVKEANVAVY